MNVYLDHSATTPVRPEVVEAMTPFFSVTFGNASSAHSFGQAARKALLKARIAIGDTIGASPEEIVLTSGGTEADNLAITGVAKAASGKHIVISAIEHRAVFNSCRHLAKHGIEVTFVPVDAYGIVDPAAVGEALRPDTALVSVMLANNETGALQPVSAISRITRPRKIPLHTDAVQALGKTPVKVDELGVDLLSISAHKIDGPKGVGALYLRKGTRLAPMLLGGHQEMNRRAGTENVAGAVGFGRAITLAESEREDFCRRVAPLRDRLEAGIRTAFTRLRINGHPQLRLPNIANLSFPGIEGETLVLLLDTSGIAVSTGAACESGAIDPSHVLTAMHVPPDHIRGAIRLSLGRTTTPDEIEYVITRIVAATSRLLENKAASQHTGGGHV